MATARITRTVLVTLLVALIAPVLWTVAPGSDEVGEAPALFAAEAGAAGDVARPTPWARGVSAPDLIDPRVGGIAARLRSHDGTPLPGRVFELMATAGSTRTVRIYDETPFTHEEGTAEDTSLSNDDAADLVAELLDVEVTPLAMTTPPGGGPSVGLTYTIGYLNLVTDGAFTGEIELAATGELRTGGYVYPVSALDEKATAAEAAGVQVLFTTSLPSAEVVAALHATVVGELFRGRKYDLLLSEERLWNRYEEWGRQAEGFTIVGVRHVGDVAAWLCGSGSEVACDVVERFDTMERPAVAGRAVTSAAIPRPAGVA